MKRKHVFILITLILLVDQCLKIWIKTSFPTGDTEVSQLSWFRLHFIENPGMAWGLKFWGETGKVMLTLFRLAAVIFGGWTVWRTVGACLLFGAATALQFQLPAMGVDVPTAALLMLPYVLTLLAVAGVVGRRDPPSALTVPYRRGA